MEDELSRSCSSSAGILSEIDSMYTKGSSVLCTSNCPCDADPTKWPQDFRKSMKTSTYGQAELSGCPIDPLTKYEKNRYVPVMEALEKTFGCAGMCKVPRFLLFSDVAK